MRIGEIYERYLIPDNLKQHMLRVAAVGLVTAEGIGPAFINRDLVVKTLLLHDMGNLLKMDFSRLDLLSQRDRERVAEIQTIQGDWKKKYGKDADDATLAILEEIGVDKSIIELCETSHGEFLQEILESGSMEQKTCFYADMRIGPFGLLDVDERFEDLGKRYPDQKDMMERYCTLTLALEDQLQQKCRIPLKQIEAGAIEKLAMILHKAVIIPE